MNHLDCQAPIHHDAWLIGRSLEPESG